MNTIKSALGVLADSRVIQTGAAAAGAILVLIPGVHLSGEQVSVAWLAVGGFAAAVDGRLARRATP